MSFESKLNRIIEHFNSINKKLMDPSALSTQEFVNLSKEYSSLSEVASIASEHQTLVKNIEDLEQLSKMEAEDLELATEAKKELVDLRNKKEHLIQELRILLLPKDEDDEKNVILEIRAGTGGEEAALFAAVLLQMYMKYAEKHGWNFEIFSQNKTGLDGYKEISANISGNGVFARLKFESGVHRVQRVPETESSGRIHTSAATVAVLPEAGEVDVKRDEKDLRIDVFRSSGAGGQHVNTTDSAVRITHLPTDIVVNQQDEKSQHKNKAKALKILRARIYELQKAEQNAKISALRKGQVGSGDRSERIRTYNYPQNRVTDHRINLTLYSLNNFVCEGEMDEIIDTLSTEEQAKKLALVED